MTCDFSQKSWDLTLGCGNVYKGQTLRELFVEGVELSIRSTMRSSWSDYREATLEDLTIKPGPYWTYKGYVEKPPRRKVNGPSLSVAALKDPKENKSHAAS